MLLTFEGCGWVGDFEKKFPASACRKKKIASSTNGINKEFLRCCIRKLFPHSKSFTKPHKTHKKIIALTYKQCITINISRNMSVVFG